LDELTVLCVIGHPLDAQVGGRSSLTIFVLQVFEEEADKDVVLQFERDLRS